MVFVVWAPGWIVNTGRPPAHVSSHSPSRSTLISVCVFYLTDCVCVCNVFVCMCVFVSMCDTHCVFVCVCMLPSLALADHLQACVITLTISPAIRPGIRFPRFIWAFSNPSKIFWPRYGDVAWVTPSFSPWNMRSGKREACCINPC